MKNITKIYNGTLVANDDISLNLNKGEILAVVGENGAGKSTIMKILYGLELPTEGEIFINGELQKFKSPQDAIKKGIGMVQQNFMLFNPFTVAENVVYGSEPKKNGLFFDREKAVEIVENLSQKYGLFIDPRLRISECSVGLQQRAEILKVLYQDADIIIFDEPSAVLTPQEVTELIETIKGLSRLGKSIILITHKLQEVMEAADRVIVMRSGKKVKEMLKTETSIEEMSLLMVGRKLIERVIPEQATGNRILEVKNLKYSTSDGKNIINGIDLHVDAGEIVGIAGVSGNGQSELIHIISGLLDSTEGEIVLDGKNITAMEVGEIRSSGLSYIPEDRYLIGCAKEANLTEVGIMGHQHKEEYSSNGILKKKSVKGFVKGLLENYSVRYGSMEQKAKELSGGNIQKLIVAREIEQDSRLLIAAEPTRGIDIGAMEFIHNQILDKRIKGDGVLLISSELSEIMALSDRIYVMYGGKINGEFARADATSEALGLLMMGGTTVEGRV